MMRPRYSRTTGERLSVPPNSWLVTKASLAVLAAMSHEDRAVVLADPLSGRAWNAFRDQLRALDRAHGSRQWIFHRPPRPDPGQPRD